MTEDSTRKTEDSVSKTEGSTRKTENSTRKTEGSTKRAGRSHAVQPRETCQMCQGTGRTAFVLPNLLHEEITCPNCDAGKVQVLRIDAEPKGDL
jgi:DnaJ-class molecular chaperone